MSMIDLHLIMGLHDRGPNEFINIEDGWTEHDIDENSGGYNLAIQNARSSCDDVRVLVVTVDESVLENMFKLEHRAPSAPEGPPVLRAVNASASK